MASDTPLILSDWHFPDIKFVDTDKGYAKTTSHLQSMVSLKSIELWINSTILFNFSKPIDLLQQGNFKFWLFFDDINWLYV